MTTAEQIAVLPHPVIPAPVGASNSRFTKGRPWLAPALVGAAGSAALFYISTHNPNRPGGFPTCPLKAATGLDCPGCGATRATYALLNGDLSAAFDHHILMPFAFPALIVAWVIWTYRSVQRGRFGSVWPGELKIRERIEGRARRDPNSATFSIKWLTPLIGLLVFSVVRNIPGIAIFEFLNSSAT